MLSQSPSLRCTSKSPLFLRPYSFPSFRLTPPTNNCFLEFPLLEKSPISLQSKTIIPNGTLSKHAGWVQLAVNDAELDRFAEVGNSLADAAGEVIRKYFRKKIEILDKEESSPVTIADREAEEPMVSIILENLPSHAM